MDDRDNLGTCHQQTHSPGCDSSGPGWGRLGQSGQALDGGNTGPMGTSPPWSIREGFQEEEIFEMISEDRQPRKRGSIFRMGKQV